MTQHLDLGDVSLAWREDGAADGPVVVFSNSLGTEMSLWDDLIPRLPASCRYIRYDMRGHGQSSVPEPPYSMGMLVGDMERLLDHLNIRDAVVVGLSIGGMIAQGLAVKRLDQVRALVLSNTAAKIGQPSAWEERIGLVADKGLGALVDRVMDLWFTKGFNASEAVEHWREMFLATPSKGYMGCCAAIAGTDFYTPTSGLRLPLLGIGGSDDGSTPADLVRETINLVPGSRFELIRKAGHLPHVEQPERYAELLTEFLTEVGHVQS